jgi:ABC-type dipeptide/oligopeptide/nickel transport system ATPase component
LINFEKICVKNGDKTLVDISFKLKKSIAIVGESGSGKSLTLKAIMEILPKELDKELVISGVTELKRGVDIAFVPQNPFTALSPMSKIKKQFWDTPKSDLLLLLKQTGLDESCLGRFPSELSGGQLQRVIIAIALASRPKLLLMDEPTTALDSDVKHEILELIRNLQKELGFYLVFVTHELGLAREFCDEILVIKNGAKVEFATSEELFNNPSDEYTKKLIDADFKGREFRK